MSKIRIGSKYIITGEYNLLVDTSPNCNTLLQYFSAIRFSQALFGISTNYGSQLDCALLIVQTTHMISINRILVIISIGVELAKVGGASYCS